MAGTLGRSIELLKDTWHVLMMDKELLLFPILSGIAILAILFTFIFPILFLGILGETGAGPVLLFLLIFLFYFVSYAVAIFFNTGLIACAAIRFSGGDPRVRDGLSAALKHLDKILAWALIAATVGLVLSSLSRKSGIAGKIVISLVGIAWSLVTFLIIPVMIFEERGVIDAIQESGRLLKKTWGENIVGNFSLGIIFIPAIVLLFLTMMAVISGNITLVIALVTLTILCFAISGVLHATLQGIFTAALYQYAKTGQTPGQFHGDLIQGAFTEQIMRGNI
ncbi:MAG: DUF6159 family protein [Methanoregulaceae archaeon]|jgi:hypothetical protein|nr:DUF6159 family protein [Methanoregulaceae archaeon]